MNLTLAVPFFNQLNEVKGILGLLRHVTSTATEWLIIDNGSTDPIETFFRHTLKPKRLNYVMNDNNVGMVNTYNQIFSLVQTDLVAVLHNDVYVYEKWWDRRVIHQFETIDRLGSLGFFGSQGVGPIGQRIQDPEFPGQMAGCSNLLEAEQHGLRLREPYRPVAILDGFAMVFDMQMIHAAHGLDTRYQYHHLYDRDLPLTSLSLGYKNIVLNIPCHHQSGVTANRHEYQAWIDRKLKMKAGADAWTHDHNSHLFYEKWKPYLPLYVEKDFSLRSGLKNGWTYKGDAILTMSKSK